MPIDLRAAIDRHCQGRLDEAARLQEAALTQEPEHADALHLLGLVNLQRGDPTRAVDLVSRAIAIRRSDAAFHATLAEAFWALGWIATLLPQATLIYCRRNLRDLALSIWMTHLAQVRWASDVDHIAARINDHVRLMQHWRKVLPIPTQR
jgi:tetratricopeptide (TPR) repeat protein